MSENANNPDLAIRAKPKPVKRFSRKALILGGTALSAGLFAALAFALQSPEYGDSERPSELYNVSHKPMNDALDALPKTYADMRPKLGPPLPGDLGAAFLEANKSGAPVAELDNPFQYTPKGTAPPRQYRQTATYQSAPAPSKRDEARESGLFFSVGSSQSIAKAPDQFAAMDAQLEQAYSNLANVNMMAGYGDPIMGNAEFNAAPAYQNSQSAFLGQSAGEIYNPYVLQSPKSPYQIMAGTLIPASLVTGLNSDLPGQVIGQVTENVYDTVTGEYLLIPQGARLLGRYDSVIAYGQSRALVAWTRIIFPNGNSIQLDNLPAVDGQGFAGLKDKVDRHTWQFMKGAVLSSLLSIGSELSSDDEGRLARALQNAGQDTANIAGQRIIERSLNIQPTLSVRPGWRFSIIVSKDLILKPYQH
ncbi:MAG: conjugal transfer protein TraI [Robiginitomaculum sp.]|nr:MAG: conjugal transfer protein TraI [Robiginitomaculum sp.]